MAATADQRRALGDRLKELRAAAGLSQEQVCQALPEHGGTDITAAAYSEYERGISAPSHPNVRALEDLLGEPRGALGGLVGYRDDDPTTAAQIAELREIVKQQGEQLQQIVRRLGLGPKGSRR